MSRTNPLTSLRRRPRQHGVGLIDALIALAILAFGLLGMTRMQSNLVRQATDSQARLTAAQLGDEILSTALVDVTNAACYTLPQDGACASAEAQARAEAWQTKVEGGTLLPGSVSATVELVDDQLTAVITWQDKAGDDDRELRVTTDVRE